MTTNVPLARPLPSLLLPPITSLPPPPGTREPVPARRPVPTHEPDALTAFLPTTRAWHRHPIDVPGSVTCALWVLFAGALGVGSWLLYERVAPSGGLVYRIATLGHPGVLLILAGIAAVTLLGLAPFTRGLTSAGGPELAAMTLAGAAGALSLVGVVVVAALTIMAVFLAVALLFVVVEGS